MRRRFFTVKENIRCFCQTQYAGDFTKSIWCTTLLWFFYLCSFFLIQSSLDLIPYKKTAFIWLIFSAPVMTGITVLYWNRYYHTVITVVLQMEHIKEKYTLVDSEKMNTYASSLKIILQLIDSSLEKEYSNSLLQKQAQLDAMQSQINPHFLYNTLDTIRGYALMEDAPLTSDMIEVLSRLFRYMISQKTKVVTLRQELSILHDYIKIQEYRNNQHIVFLQNIDPKLQVMDYRIPKLIIQPFIENAIKHGLKNSTKEFIITLGIQNTQSRLVISISDNGSGMTPEQLKLLNQKFAQNDTHSVHNSSGQETGSGIALTNVNARIRLLYGESYGVVAYSRLGRGSVFQISLPYYQN